MFWKSLLAIALCCSAFMAQAGGLSVSPLGIDLRDGEKTEVLHLRNQGDEEIKVQVRAFGWTQVQGKDHLTPTRQVLVSPQVVSIAPGREQIVRVVLSAPLGAAQQSYRLFVDELPAKGANAPRRLKILLRYSLPLFFSSSPQPPPVLKVSAVAGGFGIRAKNDGTQYAKLVGVKVNGKMIIPGLAGYVLPASVAVFPVKASPGDRIEAMVNGKPLSVTLAQ